MRIITVGKPKQNVTALPRVRAYPNPAKVQLVIESLSDGINLQKLILFDSYGQEIISAAATSVSKSLDLSGILQGIYFLKVYLENNTSKTLRVTIIR